MAEFKYALTRVCLRSGTLTLPGKLLDVFPAEGEVEVVDAATDDVHVATIEGPRTVAGLGPLFAAHDLEVNDELVIRPLDDRRYAVTPVRRVRRPDWSRPEVVREFLDALVAENRPLTEAEIRALHPYVPTDADLRGLLRAEPRLVRVEGRWRPAEAAGGTDAAEATADGAGAERPHEGSRGVQGDADAEGAAPRGRGASSGHDASSGGDIAAGSETAAGDDMAPGQENPAGSTLDDRTARGRPEGDAESSHRGLGAAGAPGTGDASADATPAEPSGSRRRAPTVVGVPSAGADVGHAGLNSEQDPADLQAVRRARIALEAVGFQVESLGHGQLMATAELGRRSYRALVHTHPEGARLEWAALLARRRDLRAAYLAVFADHRDLARLQAPAELARASLWSWSGVQRMVDLARTVLVSPVDLETHFERAGLFEHGLERFEQAIAKRIAERGAFSAVLTRLASMRAPAIFLLEDVAVDVDLPREQLVRILERLGEAPFHLVARVDSGEFCLRYRVSDALQQLAEYADSLRDRLPDRRRERLVGLPDEPVETPAVRRRDARAMVSTVAAPAAGERAGADARDAAADPFLTDDPHSR